MGRKLLVSPPASVPRLRIVPRDTDKLWKGPNPKEEDGQMWFCGCSVWRTHKGSSYTGSVEEVQVQQLCCIRHLHFTLVWGHQSAAIKPRNREKHHSPKMNGKKISLFTCWLIWVGQISTSVVCTWTAKLTSSMRQQIGKKILNLNRRTLSTTWRLLMWKWNQQDWHHFTEVMMLNAQGWRSHLCTATLTLAVTRGFSSTQFNTGSVSSICVFLSDRVKTSQITCPPLMCDLHPKS